LSDGPLIVQGSRAPLDAENCRKACSQMGDLLIGTHS
jgi:hypothetical protein